MSIIAVFTLVFLLARPSVFAQTPHSRPLGDVAREEQQKHTTQKDISPRKVYENEDLNVTGGAPANNTGRTPPASTPARDPFEKAQNESDRTEAAVPASTKDVAGPTRRADDRPADAEPDVLLVPAGTQIKVQMSDVPWPAPRACAAKVVMPVRVGFTTAIPAGSIVSVQVTPPDYSWLAYPGVFFVPEETPEVLPARSHSQPPPSRRTPPSSAVNNQGPAVNNPSRITSSTYPSRTMSGTYNDDTKPPHIAHQHRPVEMSSLAANGGYMELTSITLQSVTYDVHTDILPFAAAGLEITFTLIEPLQILRQ